MKNNKIEKCLRDLAAKNCGVLVPEDVVEAARNPRSPLHCRFEWDDGEAAHQWRLWQARQLIRVCVEVAVPDMTPTPVFVSLSTDRGRARGGYRVTTTVMSDAELRAQLLKDALFEANLWAQKYAHLQELAQVFESLRRVKAA